MPNSSGRRRDTQHRFQPFFATRRKLSGRNGKRSASPDYPERWPQTKTRKGNQIMKNRNVQFKPTAGFRSRCCSPALRQCLSRHPLRQQPATWCRSMPLSRGTLKLRSFCPECTLHGHAIVFGNANQLGVFTGTGEFSRPCTRSDLCENNVPYTGSFHWFAANGDEIFGTFEGYLTRQKRRECSTTMKPRR